jgi:putative SOS response-associated peptidase YedK
MCNLYSNTTNQAAIIALFRVVNRYVGNLAPMTGVFPDCPAPVVRNAGTERELVMMCWGMTTRLLVPVRAHWNVQMATGTHLSRSSILQRMDPGRIY